jgi:hypothetical protein
MFTGTHFEIKKDLPNCKSFSGCGIKFPEHLGDFLMRIPVPALE